MICTSKFGSSPLGIYKTFYLRLHRRAPEYDATPRRIFQVIGVYRSREAFIDARWVRWLPRACVRLTVDCPTQAYGSSAWANFELPPNGLMTNNASDPRH